MFKNPLFRISFKKITIPHDINTRLDQFVASHSNLNWGQVQKLLKKRLIYVTPSSSADAKIKDNGYKLRKNDQISFMETIEFNDNIKFGSLGVKRHIEDKKYTDSMFDAIKVVETDDFIVINKPVGIYSQGTGVLKLNLPNIVNSYYNHRGKQIKANVVHRIDKPVSGLIVLALNPDFSKSISEQIKERKVDKTYVTICEGVPEGYLKVDATHIECYMRFSESNQRAIVENGKETDESRKTKCSARILKVLAYNVKTDLKSTYDISKPDRLTALKRFLKTPDRENIKFYSMVEYKLITGKRHQLRAVSKYILGTPILYDFKYGYNSPSPQSVEYGVHGELTDEGFKFSEVDVVDRYLKEQYKSKEYIYLMSKMLSFSSTEENGECKKYEFEAPFNHHFNSFLSRFDLNNESN